MDIKMKHGESLKSTVAFTWNTNDSTLTPHFSFPKEASPNEALEIVKMMRDALAKNVEQAKLCPLHRI